MDGRPANRFSCRKMKRGIRSPHRGRRWLIATGLAAMLAAGAVASCAPLGARATGARLERMRKSPEWQGSHFENPQPIVNDLWAAIVHQFKGGANMEPTSPPSTVAVEPGRFATPPASGIRVTWLGHSTILLEIDGHRFLTDPVWSERVGPVSFAGPKRWFPPPLALRDLPPLDAVVLSHDHYDHLDYATIVALKDRNPTFVAPLGVGPEPGFRSRPGAREGGARARWGSRFDAHPRTDP
jgi:Beta-lactamase superfamily domain